MVSKYEIYFNFQKNGKSKKRGNHFAPSFSIEQKILPFSILMVFNFRRKSKVGTWVPVSPTDSCIYVNRSYRGFPFRTRASLITWLASVLVIYAGRFILLDQITFTVVHYFASVGKNFTLLQLVILYIADHSGVQFHI